MHSPPQIGFSDIQVKQEWGLKRRSVMLLGEIVWNNVLQVGLKPIRGRFALDVAWRACNCNSYNSLILSNMQGHWLPCSSFLTLSEYLTQAHQRATNAQELKMSCLLFPARKSYILTHHTSYYSLSDSHRTHLPTYHPAVEGAYRYYCQPRFRRPLEPGRKRKNRIL